MKKILFITTANLTTNPRLVKEVDTLKTLFKIDVVAFKLGNWSDTLENKDLTDRITMHYLNATRKPFKSWLFFFLIEKISEAITLLQPNSWLAGYAISKRTYQIISYGKSLKRGNYDLIIGHNIAALYPSYILSKRLRTKFAFDVEDYHPGEKSTGKDATLEKKRREHLLKKYLPAAAYVSFASPLIQEETLKLLGGDQKLKSKSLILNNTFLASEFKNPETKHTDNFVHFVWFSQYVTLGRGLEEMIPVLSSFANRVRLTIIGSVKDEIKPLLESYKDILIIQPPLSQQDLHNRLSSFDIGLSLDSPIGDFNREIALPNKIFAYLQAGLFTFARETKSQVRFLKENKDSGDYFNDSNIIDKLKNVIDNIEVIRSKKKDRFSQAHSFSWEEERKKLIERIEEIL